MDLAILLNTYKNTSAHRKLTEKEWLVCQAIEEKFVSMLKQVLDPNCQTKPVLMTADLTMFIYCLGILDMGSTQTW
jgi:hypothetical protein